MPLTDQERSLYLAWYHSTHLAQPLYQNALDRALRRFGDDTAEPDPSLFLGCISSRLINQFSEANALINH